MSFSNLPLTSEILDAHRCTLEPECTCNKESGSSKLVEDKRLKHWREWMTKRKSMHKKLGSLLKRDSGTLLMNSVEELRTLRENKIAFDYTKIPKPDPQRGCPGFWKLPFELKEKPSCPAPCFAVVTKEDKCEIPIIEHVSVPKEILKEKDVFPIKRSVLTAWDKSLYVHNKREEFREELEVIVPYKPVAEELVITGLPIGKRTNVTKRLVELQTPPVKEEPNVSQKPSVLRLLINDILVSPHVDLSGTRKIYTFFDYNVNCKKIATKYLKLKNLGTTTIRFSWQICEPTSLFRDIIPLKNRDNCFYFDQNENIILPGHSYNFPFWFKTESIGVYFEQWEFLTKPRVTPPNLKIIVVLHASAIAEDVNEKMFTIKERLDSEVRSRLIIECLSAVLDNVPYVKTKPTVYVYNKKEIFETVNTKFNAFNRHPNYVYNKEIVRELQKFYKTVRRSMDPKCWNYRIDELRLLSKAIEKEGERNKGLSEPRQATIKIAESHQSKANAEPVSENDTDADTKRFTNQLNEIISKLEKPSLEPNLEKDKLVQAYFIFSSFITKMENDLEELRDKFGIIKVCKYPKFPSDYTPFVKTPTRLVQDTPFEIFQGPQLREQVGLPSDLPPAECLLEIPGDDYRKRYRTYYNIPDTPPLKSAKGKPDKKKDAKDKKGGKDTKKGKGEPKKEVESDEDQGMVIDRSFDPYAHIEPPFGNLDELSIREESEADYVSNVDLLSPALLAKYSYNTYVIVYKHLENAIMNIVDMIEIQPKTNLPYGVIKEVESQKYNSRLIDLKGLIAQEAIDKANAKLILNSYRKQCKKDFEAFEIKRQLKRKPSDTSLWSLLREYRSEEKFNTKPISYPMKHYHESRRCQMADASLVHGATSTSDAKLDPDLPDFKEVAVQRDYGEGEDEEDLVAYVEKVVSEISLNDLIDAKHNRATQKNLEDHVSDEEPFYDSETDDDYSSISSEPYVEVCLCEGSGVCGKDVEEEEKKNQCC